MDRDQPNATAIGAETTIDGPGVRGGIVGPYPERKLVRIFVHSHNVKTGDPASADFQFFFNGAVAANRHDEKFDTAKFDVQYDAMLDAGATCAFHFLTGHVKAREVDYGFRVVLTPYPTAW